MSIETYEDALVFSARNGCAPAFDELTRLYADRVRTLAYVSLGREDQAEKVRDTVFAAARKNLSRLGEDRDFAVWIQQITRSCCDLVLKKQDPQSLEEEPPAFLPDEPEQLLPEAYLRRGDLQQRMAERLRALPLRQRQTLALSCRDLMTPEEIAKVTGCDPDRARARVNSVRRAIREELAAEEWRSGMVFPPSPRIPADEFLKTMTGLTPVRPAASPVSQQASAPAQQASASAQQAASPQMPAPAYPPYPAESFGARTEENAWPPAPEQEKGPARTARRGSHSARGSGGKTAIRVAAVLLLLAIVILGAVFVAKPLLNRLFHSVGSSARREIELKDDEREDMEARDERTEEKTQTAPRPSGENTADAVYRAFADRILSDVSGGQAARYLSHDDQPEGEDAEAYIEFYQACFSEGLDAEAIRGLSYALVDLDGDGRDELLLGDPEKGFLIIYTLNGGGLHYVSSFSYRSQAWVWGKTIFAGGSMSAAMSIDEFLVLEPGATELTMVLGIVYDYRRGDPEICRVEEGFSIGDGTDPVGEVLTDAQREELCAPYLEGEAPEWKPLSELGSAGADAGELYRAYRQLLQERKDAICAYWGGKDGVGSGLTVLHDVDNDGFPELIFVEAGSGNESWKSTLYIYGKGADGSVKQLYSRDWDYAAGGGMSYALFSVKQDGEPPALYAMCYESRESGGVTLIFRLQKGRDGQFESRDVLRRTVWGQMTEKGYQETRTDWLSYRDTGDGQVEEPVSEEAFRAAEQAILDGARFLLMKHGSLLRGVETLDLLYQRDGDRSMTWQQAMDRLLELDQ